MSVDAGNGFLGKLEVTFPVENSFSEYSAENVKRVGSFDEMVKKSY